MRGDRGASILAGLVLMAMLGAAAAGVGSSNVYNATSQVAAPPPINAATKAEVEAAKQATAAIEGKCEKQKDAAARAEKDVGDVPNQPVASGTIEQDNCVSAVFDLKTAQPFYKPVPELRKLRENYTCVGKRTTINIVKGAVTMTSVIDQNSLKGKCTSESGKEFSGTDSLPKMIASDPQLLARLTLAGLPPEQLKAITGTMDKSQLGALNDALGGQRADILNDVDDQENKVDQAKENELNLKRIADQCDSQFGDESCIPKYKEAEDATKTRQDAEQKRAELLKQSESLAAAQKSLAGVAEKGDPATVVTCTTPTTCKYPDGRPAPVPPPGPPPPPPSGPPGGGGQTGFGDSGDISKILKSLMGGDQKKGGAPPTGNQSPQAPGTCAAGQLLCSGNTLYSRNNQCVDTVVQVCQYGCSGNACTQQGQNCPAAPVQPDPGGCQSGTWKPTYSGACVNGWQCTSGTGGSGQPTAQISCQPQVADVGMSIAISYACTNSTASASTAFSTGGALSGSATVVVANPPAGTNTAIYGIGCSNNNPGQTAAAQCTVQVGKPSIVLVANPKAVATSTASQLGWVTSGMQSCVISSPDLPAFTAQNAGNTIVSGTATTPPLSSAARFLLHCITVGGGTRDATTTVSIIGIPDTFNGSSTSSVTVSSTIDATTVAHGATATTTWSTRNAPSGSAVSLWIFDVRLNQTTVLITDAQSTSGSFVWRIPALTDSCDTNSSIVCGSDLVTGRKYLIEAALYTPANAYLGNGAPPANPIDPTYIDFGFADPFTMGQ